MRILLAVDGSPFSETALNEVALRPWPSGSEVKIISAFQAAVNLTPEFWPLPDEYIETLERTAQKVAEAVVQRSTTKLKDQVGDSLNVTGEVIAGSARDVILDAAAAWPADLIVVGSHGYGAWQRFLLGSVSQAIVSRAPCSVEVVHIRRKNRTKKAA